MIETVTLAIGLEN